MLVSLFPKMLWHIWTYKACEADSHWKNNQEKAHLLCLSVPLYLFVNSMCINLFQLLNREWGISLWTNRTSTGFKTKSLFIVYRKYGNIITLHLFMSVCMCICLCLYVSFHAHMYVLGHKKPHFSKFQWLDKKPTFLRNLWSCFPLPKELLPLAITTGIRDK